MGGEDATPLRPRRPLLRCSPTTAINADDRQVDHAPESGLADSRCSSRRLRCRAQVRQARVTLPARVARKRMFANVYS